MKLEYPHVKNHASDPVSPQAAAKSLHKKQLKYFRTGQTLSLKFRKYQLQTLLSAVERFEPPLIQALYQDLHKPTFEAYASEFGALKSEIKTHIRKLNKWARPQSATTPLLLFPSKSKIYRQPYGVVVNISPWNYPLLLSIGPLVSAMAAGNTLVLKPSEHAPNVANVMAKLVSEYFPEEYFSVQLGDSQVTQALLDQPLNYVFFTGSTQVGRIIAQRCAEQLIPNTLELGGKSPCLVDPEMNLDLAARRIVWGKFYNAGQTCVAPDYVYISKELQGKLIERLSFYIQRFFGSDRACSADYGRIISPQHFQRLLKLFNQNKIAFGGKVDEGKRFIEPTILKDVTWDDKVMQEEIFGPILPILTFDHWDQAIEKIVAGPAPLAVYLFSKNPLKKRQVINTIPFGGGCINDTIVHVSNHHLPFGGVGHSGMGQYHGKFGFETFSHRKGIMESPTAIDLPLRYPPYGRFDKILKKFF